eukprot:CAMPEP_0177613008 /NCGR_PEP_ID=MMETSP0419_2-20121207/21657_1 /TAXON_ID=582737 /ORGANISM="Tetraselmis sp., Strain GSL018" /LENGTH=53 /DNA_ID=CAMNT_0019109499 /DNA_START=70 /DNA_END=227 /DNA_ORIENTATION=+
MSRPLDRKRASATNASCQEITVSSQEQPSRQGNRILVRRQGGGQVGSRADRVP